MRAVGREKMEDPMIDRVERDDQVATHWGEKKNAKGGKAKTNDPGSTQPVKRR